MTQTSKCVLLVLFLALASCGQDATSSQWDIHNSMPGAEGQESEPVVEDIWVENGGMGRLLQYIRVTLGKPTACVTLTMVGESSFGPGETPAPVETPDGWALGGADIRLVACSEIYSFDGPRYGAESASGRIVYADEEPGGMWVDVVLDFDPSVDEIPSRVVLEGQRVDW